MLNIQSFDINQVIKSTAASFEGTCTTRQILLELVLSGKELYARADIGQIQQVLYNLLSNAIEFSPDHSTITIETTEKNDKIFVSGKKASGVGIGINKIWERFSAPRQRPERHRSRTGDRQRDHFRSRAARRSDSRRGRRNKIIFTLEKAK